MRGKKGGGGERRGGKRRGDGCREVLSCFRENHHVVERELGVWG